jgi:hypothetical protein
MRKLSHFSILFNFWFILTLFATCHFLPIAISKTFKVMSFSFLALYSCMAQVGPLHYFKLTGQFTGIIIRFDFQYELMLVLILEQGMLFFIS